MAEQLDVQCPACGAAHRFDKARLPAVGLRVNCQQCQQPYTVSRDQPPAAPGWMLRKVDGEIRHFDDLAVLKQWIGEQQVQPDDEISKTGRQWKRLGSIKDLEPHFTHALPTTVATPPETDALGALPAAFPGAGPQMATADDAPSEKLPVDQTEWTLTDLEPPADASFIVPDDSIVSAAPKAAPPPSAPKSLAPPPPAPKPLARTPELSPRVLQETVYMAPPTTSHRVQRRRVLLALVLLFAATLVVAFVERHSWFAFLIEEPIPEAAITQVSAAERVLRRDSNVAIAQALHVFEQVAAQVPRYAPAHAGIAAAEIARADGLTLEADELERNVTLASQSAALRQEASQRAARARAVAQQALALDPNAPMALVALADVYLNAQEVALLRSALDQLRQVAPGEPDVLCVLGADAARRGDRASAQRQLERALLAGADRQRARFKLALLQAGAGQADAALTTLGVLLADVPDHERALTLQRRLQAEQVPPPVVTETNATVQPPPIVESTDKATGERLTFHQLLAKADRLRRRDQTRAALALFEKALVIEPEDPDALTGMGWCYLDLDRIDAALAVFGKIAERLPRYSDAHLGLAEGYRAKGLKDRAIQHYETYLDIMPNGPEANAARRTLEKLHAGE